MANVKQIPAHEVPNHWRHIEPHLTRALDQIDSGLTLDDVLDRLIDGDMQCWKIGHWEGVAVTQICHLPLFRMLMVLYLAGDNMSQWLEDLMTACHEFAEHTHCRYVEIFGRPGWERVFKSHGGDKSYIVMRFKTDGWKFTANTNQQQHQP